MLFHSIDQVYEFIRGQSYVFECENYLPSYHWNLQIRCVESFGEPALSHKLGHPYLLHNDWKWFMCGLKFIFKNEADYLFFKVAFL